MFLMKEKYWWCMLKNMENWKILDSGVVEQSRLFQYMLNRITGS